MLECVCLCEGVYVCVCVCVCVCIRVCVVGSVGGQGVVVDSLALTGLKFDPQPSPADCRVVWPN